MIKYFLRVILDALENIGRLTTPCFVDFFVLAPIDARPECGKVLRTGTLAMQAL